MRKRIILWYVCNNYGDIIWSLSDGTTHQGTKEDFENAKQKFIFDDAKMSTVKWDDPKWQTT